MNSTALPLYVPTGVRGLDDILLGGFLREGFYLIQGDPGSGKSTLALQFLLARKRAGQRCLYVSLTESITDLENTARSHDWSLDGLEVCDLTGSAANMAGIPESSVFHPSETELGETANYSQPGSVPGQTFDTALIAIKPVGLVAQRPAHIAAALSTPVVDLCALTNPQHTPWQVASRVLNFDVPCRHCLKSICPQGHQHCLSLVSPGEVCQATLELWQLQHQRVVTT